MKWVGSNELNQLLSIPKENILVFDTETTGIYSSKDEMLQLSMVDGNGTVLFSSYLKPTHTDDWSEATEINGITNDMVEDAPTFAKVKKEVQRLFMHADLVVGYNLEFDLKFLKAKKICLKEGSHTFDVMKEFSQLRAIPRSSYNADYKWFKLGECAKYFGYEFNAHDALEDTNATLFCFNALLNNPDYQDLVTNGRRRVVTPVASPVTTPINTNVSSNESKYEPESPKRKTIRRIGWISIPLGIALGVISAEDSFIYNLGCFLFFFGIITVIAARRKRRKKNRK